jgi:hypothetical protein
MIFEPSTKEKKFLLASLKAVLFFANSKTSIGLQRGGPKSKKSEMDQQIFMWGILKGRSITLPLTSCLTGLESAV